jgi:hypothetical protein
LGDVSIAPGTMTLSRAKEFVVTVAQLENVDTITAASGYTIYQRAIVSGQAIRHCVAVGDVLDDRNGESVDVLVGEHGRGVGGGVVFCHRLECTLVAAPDAQPYALNGLDSRPVRRRLDSNRRLAPVAARAMR